MKMDLTTRLIKQCVAQPETGMGWQSVTVVLKVDRSEHQGMVFGSSDLILDLEEITGEHKDFIHPNMIEEIIVNNKYNHNAFSGGE